MKKIFMITVLGLFIVSLVGAYVYSAEDKQIEKLTPSQIDKMIELGVIKVHPDLPHNPKDIVTGLVYQTEYGECDLYQDIMGRYYCRW